MCGTNPRNFEEVKRGTEGFVEDKKQNARIVVERQDKTSDVAIKGLEEEVEVTKKAKKEPPGRK